MAHFKGCQVVDCKRSTCCDNKSKQTYNLIMNIPLHGEISRVSCCSLLFFTVLNLDQSCQYFFNLFFLVSQTRLINSPYYFQEISQPVFFLYEREIFLSNPEVRHRNTFVTHSPGYFLLILNNTQ